MLRSEPIEIPSYEPLSACKGHARCAPAEAGARPATRRARAGALRCARWGARKAPGLRFHDFDVCGGMRYVVWTCSDLRSAKCTKTLRLCCVLSGLGCCFVGVEEATYVRVGSGVEQENHAPQPRELPEEARPGQKFRCSIRQ